MGAMKINNVLQKSGMMCRQFRLRIVPVCLMLLVFAGVSMGREISSKTRITELPFKIISAEETKFEKSVHIGTGIRNMDYREALVLKVVVNRDAFDSLPPNIEPFLYIGSHEYHIFHIDRDDQKRDLILIFHIPKWNQLEEGAPVVLTIDQGAPIRNPENFVRRKGPRFYKKMIVNKR
jgi:hypothetical protein